ncbi:MAG: methionine sulfoxide reductase heme-binding subunit [Pseudomonadota bacterium]|jgi:DMSO/TMAO reductase YedYZ heme-binding membrane subunit|nr:methionine sulfoxide reductase heme-binding subunit [Pseudomonadota bacterium]
MTRTHRHLMLAAGVAAISAAAMAVAPAGQALDRLSFVTAWLCLLFFAGTLLIGPLQVRRTGRLPGNHLLRRDLGIWCVITGMVHFFLAFKVSMNLEYMAIYVRGAEAWPAPAVRELMYRWAVLASLVIAVLFMLLLALSNNLAIRLLGKRWWKRLQRVSYAAFALTVGHSIAFQILEARNGWLVAAFIVITAAVLIAQYAGRARLRGSDHAPEL